jgi:putative transposase
MPKSKSPTFICELPLRLSSTDERGVAIRFDVARQAYNACLSESLRRLDLMRASKAYQAARQWPKGEKNTRAAKARAKAFQAVNQRFSFREYDLHTWATHHLSHTWLGEHLDSNTVQKLATRAFQATQTYAFGRHGRPRFKGRLQLDSLEGKSNQAGIRWRADHVEWSGLNLPALIDPQDKVIAHGLKSRVKYVRLVRRKLNGRPRYFAQLICEGLPYRKEQNPIGQSVVGLDLGPSTVAIVAPSAHTASLEQFCAELIPQHQTIRRWQRKIDRQRRANNPANYNPNGTVKPGARVWRTSARQRETQSKVAELKRQQAAYRESLHGQTVNRILCLGNLIQLEKISYRSFQRNFGPSVNFRAPGMFVAALKRKAENAGVQVNEFSTRTTRLSQVCHQCGTLSPKPLAVRWHDCACGVVAQRDLYSAFLAACVDGERLNADQARELWSGVDPLLQAAVSRIDQPTRGGHRPASFGVNVRRSPSRSPVQAGMKTVEAQEVVPFQSSERGALERDRVIPRTPRRQAWGEVS